MRNQPIPIALFLLICHPQKVSKKQKSSIRTIQQISLKNTQRNYASLEPSSGTPETLSIIIVIVVVISITSNASLARQQHHFISVGARLSHDCSKCQVRPCAWLAGGAGALWFSASQAEGYLH
jgi:hypothetical protein